MTARKVLLLILDGISDRPSPALHGLTPLQAARTPNLDRIAREGICGIMDPIAPGIRPGSDTSHLNLLGYPPDTYYTGRGPLEALGTGIFMEPGMIGFRCNYATLDDHGRVIDRRAGRIHQTDILSAAIQNQVDLSKRGVTFEFRSGAGHRAALAFHGENLGAFVSSNDPKKDGVTPPAFRELDDSDADRRTAAALNDFVKQAEAVLQDHPLNTERRKKGFVPANTVLIRGAGKMGYFEPFSERYGLSGSVISGATLINGIGAAIGLRHIAVPGATGSTDTDLKGKVQAVLKELERQDFVLFNIKGADEAGHDGRAVEKKEFVEKVDTSLKPLLGIEDCLLVVCADHSTPCTIRDHSADPVPLAIRGEGVRIDEVFCFDELSCTRGGLLRLPGSALMPVIMDLIDRAKKYGA